MPQATRPTSSMSPMGTQQVSGQVSPQPNDTQPNLLREPPTGRQFLEKLRDGRVIYFDGKLVKDVTTPVSYTHLTLPTILRV